MAGKITERTLYEPLMQIIHDNGGTSVSEISFKDVSTGEEGFPDIVFDFCDRKWILGVKIGFSPKIMLDAFVQLQNHKQASGIENCILLFVPERIRVAKPERDILIKSLNYFKSYCIIDTKTVKEESQLYFPLILSKIKNEVVPSISRNEEKYYTIEHVIVLLRQQVSDLMENIDLTDEAALRIITDKKLLSEIGHIDEKENNKISQFLASYIILSQIIFLRLYSRTNQEILPPQPQGTVTIGWLRQAFSNVSAINYRPIYSFDVLNTIPEKYVHDTFYLIWGLEIEQVKHDLPGRLFHELMPPKIRKMLAAFYTRPCAADLLAKLTIKKWDNKVLDPSCGSGTILVSAYKQKNYLYHKQFTGNPHKQFCENDIFGADIMPFAVHLTGANLASLDPSTTIDKVQIGLGDSLELNINVPVENGSHQTVFPEIVTGYTTQGLPHLITINAVDTILMNPPFTKVERGIKKYVDMDKYKDICGGDVGLWGHFLAFTDVFLKDEGIFGGVIPISLLRGSEGEKVRDLVFNKWTPLYIIKTTKNYGFSEHAEYRDILVIARKSTPAPNHKVKFILIKKDITEVKNSDVDQMVDLIETKDSLRSQLLDIESFSSNEMKSRFNNLMYFCGTTNFTDRDALISFKNKFANITEPLPEKYFKEGYRAVPKGVSKFMFITKKLEDSRVENAFLIYEKDNPTYITAKTKSGIKYKIEKEAFKPSLRTGVGIKTISINGKVDYVAKMPYNELTRVLEACGYEKPGQEKWKAFWDNIDIELPVIETNLVVVHRINPYSPSTYLISFFSDEKISPNNVLNVIAEPDKDTAKAFNVLLNSSLFLCQFFLLKEETTGRNINVRFYDFKEMDIFPSKDNINALARVFDDWADVEFPSLREQMDKNFDYRFESYKRKRKKQTTLFFLESPIESSDIRVKFDKAVFNAIGVQVTDDELYLLYDAITEEMIINKGLQKD